MAASGSLAGGTGSWALLWAAVQACHMVRLGQAGHHAGLAAAPAGSKGQSLCPGPGAVRQKCPVRQPVLGVWRMLAAPNLSCLTFLPASVPWLPLLKPPPLGLGDNPPARRSASGESKKAAQREGSLGVCSLQPLCLCPAQPDSSCGSPATAVLNKNRNKQPLLFKLLPSNYGIYLHRQNRRLKKKHHQEPLYSADQHPYLNFINI